MSEPVNVTRKIDLDTGSEIQDIKLALECLRSLPGLRVALYDTVSTGIEVEFDLLKTCYSDITEILRQKNVPLRNRIKDRLLSARYEYLDETARVNANALPAASCNKPPRRIR